MNKTTVAYYLDELQLDQNEQTQKIKNLEQKIQKLQKQTGNIVQDLTKLTDSLGKLVNTVNDILDKLGPVLVTQMSSELRTAKYFQLQNEQKKKHNLKVYQDWLPLLRGKSDSVRLALNRYRKLRDEFKYKKESDSVVYL